MKRTRLRRVSRKRALELKIYAQIRKDFLFTHSTCQFPGCVRLASDVHHVRGRLGSRLLDQRSWKAVCRICHTWLHDHPKEARKMGWIKP